MAKSYKPRRVKLKRHDQGQDRHNKGTALWSKQLRLEHEHAAGKGARKKIRNARKRKIKEPYRNEALRAYVDELRRQRDSEQEEGRAAGSGPGVR
jgi:hypothetical protein